MNYSKASSNKLLSQVAKNNDQQRKEIIDIDMSLIDENPDNDKIFCMDKIEGLARAIETEGWTGAIEVYATGNGRYMISSGHRRFRAMKMLGKKTIPCEITRYVNDVAMKKKLLSSNIHNRDMTAMDWARALRYYIENVTEEKKDSKRTRKECREFFNMTDSMVSRYLALLELIPELQVYAAKKDFPVSALPIAAKLTKEAQKQLAGFIDTWIIDQSKRLYRSNPEAEKEDESYLISKNTVIAEIQRLKGGPTTRSNKPKTETDDIKQDKETEEEQRTTEVPDRLEERERLMAYSVGSNEDYTDEDTEDSLDRSDKEDTAEDRKEAKIDFQGFSSVCRSVKQELDGIKPDDIKEDYKVRELLFMLYETIKSKLGI